MLSWHPACFLTSTAAALLAALVTAFAAPTSHLSVADGHTPIELAYSTPDPGLTPSQRERFEQGARLFRQRWVVAPSAFGQWGRGPLSNGEACTDCHPNNGRGRPPLTLDEPVRFALLRLSIGRPEAAVPHPVYGDQLQQQGVLGQVPGEGEAFVSWSERSVTFADGTVVMLRRPQVRFEALAYGPIDAGAMTSLRVAPPLIGVGLLEAVSSAALERIAGLQRKAGFAGRVHWIDDAGYRVRAAGRFGHKAGRASVREQISAALHSDLGVTSSLFPAENCAPPQHACRAFPVAGAPEIGDTQLGLLEDYLRRLQAPPRRQLDDPQVLRGERLFTQLQCSVCHAPALPLESAGAARMIHPYSDLLLHDLGPGLADAAWERHAGPRDWRTAPLWGLGLSQAVSDNAFLLHDGRARTPVEAILWHAGEAQPARDAFLALPADSRAALVTFLNSL